LIINFPEDLRFEDSSSLLESSDESLELLESLLELWYKGLDAAFILPIGNGTDDGAANVASDGATDTAGDGVANVAGDGATDTAGDGVANVAGDGVADVAGDRVANGADDVLEVSFGGKCSFTCDTKFGTPGVHSGKCSTFTCLDGVISVNI